MQRVFFLCCSSLACMAEVSFTLLVSAFASEEVRAVLDGEGGAGIHFTLFLVSFSFQRQCLWRQSEDAGPCHHY